MEHINSRGEIGVQGVVQVAQPDPPQSKRDPARGTILLVEDENSVRKVTRQVLQDAGYGVLEAGCAAEASVAFHSCPAEVRLLLTDVVLPDRNGCELSAELTSNCSSLKTLFISGYPENAVTRQGSQHRGSLYLPKPFSVKTLLEQIRHALAEDGEAEP